MIPTLAIELLRWRTLDMHLHWWSQGHMVSDISRSRVGTATGGGQMTQLDFAGQEAPQRLRPGMSLLAAAAAFRADLERKRRPRNTIESYLFDLTVLAHQIPEKAINQISADDIMRFLGEANTVSTRKRRLTSVRRFFRFLVDDAMVLSIDPTEDFYPNRVELKVPEPLSPAEQEALSGRGGRRMSRGAHRHPHDDGCRPFPRRAAEARARQCRSVRPARSRHPRRHR